MNVPVFSAATLGLASWSPSRMILVLFKLLLLHCISGQVGLHVSTLGVNFTFAQVLVVPLDLIPTDFQDQKYWGLAFGTGPRGWSA